MAQILSDRDTAELMSVLSSNYVVDVCEGAGRVITASLPGKAVCAIQRVGGVLYFIVDVEKPLAYSHARQMIREWRETCGGPADAEELEAAAAIQMRVLARSRAARSSAST